MRGMCGVSYVKYGRRSRAEFLSFLRCLRIRLDVIYIHVESNDVLRRIFEHAHWDVFTNGACAVKKKRKIRGVKPNLNKTRPQHPLLN